MSYAREVTVDLDVIDALRSKGVTRATFHDNGQIASVEFEEAAPDATEPQNEAPAPVKRSARPGLVPRVERSV